MIMELNTQTEYDNLHEGRVYYRAGLYWMITDN